MLSDTSSPDKYAKTYPDLDPHKNSKVVLDFVNGFSDVNPCSEKTEEGDDSDADEDEADEDEQMEDEQEFEEEVEDGEGDLMADLMDEIDADMDDVTDSGDGVY